MSVLCFLSLQLVDQFLLENVSVGEGAGAKRQSQLYIGETGLCGRLVAGREHVCMLGVYAHHVVSHNMVSRSQKQSGR